MIETSSLATAFPPAAVEPTARSSASRLARPGTDSALEPAVTLDLSPEARQSQAAPPSIVGTADRARYRLDTESQQVVFQVVGPDGTVVEQLPSEAFLRARSYARGSEAAREAEIGTSVARSA